MPCKRRAGVSAFPRVTPSHETDKLWFNPDVGAGANTSERGTQPNGCGGLTVVLIGGVPGSGGVSGSSGPGHPQATWAGRRGLCRGRRERCDARGSSGIFSGRKLPLTQVSLSPRAALCTCSQTPTLPNHVPASGPLARASFLSWEQTQRPPGGEPWAPVWLPAVPWLPVDLVWSSCDPGGFLCPPSGWQAGEGLGPVTSEGSSPRAVFQPVPDTLGHLCKDHGY